MAVVGAGVDVGIFQFSLGWSWDFVWEKGWLRRSPPNPPIFDACGGLGEGKAEGTGISLREIFWTENNGCRPLPRRGALSAVSPRG